MQNKVVPFGNLSGESRAKYYGGSGKKPKGLAT